MRRQAAAGCFKTWAAPAMWNLQCFDIFESLGCWQWDYWDLASAQRSFRWRICWEHNMKTKAFKSGNLSYWCLCGDWLLVRPWRISWLLVIINCPSIAAFDCSLHSLLIQRSHQRLYEFSTSKTLTWLDWGLWWFAMLALAMKLLSMPPPMDPVLPVWLY